MGMAAGQARLLSITSRMSDNELRAQLINNDKMRLATESSRVSEAYVAALNDAQMMFTNYDAKNNKTYQQLTFNALTSYNPYNNQYALSNASGNVLISEKDAANYEKSNSVDEFLACYGLEKTSMFFDDTLGKNVNKDTGTVTYPLVDRDGNPVLNNDGTQKIHDTGLTPSQLKEIYFGTNGKAGMQNVQSSEEYWEFISSYDTFMKNMDEYRSYANEAMKAYINRINFTSHDGYSTTYGKFQDLKNNLAKAMTGDTSTTIDSYHDLIQVRDDLFGLFSADNANDPTYDGGVNRPFWKMLSAGGQEFVTDAMQTCKDAINKQPTEDFGGLENIKITGNATSGFTFTFPVVKPGESADAPKEIVTSAKDKNNNSLPASGQELYDFQFTIIKNNNSTEPFYKVKFSNGDEKDLDSVSDNNLYTIAFDFEDDTNRPIGASEQIKIGSDGNPELDSDGKVQYVYEDEYGRKTKNDSTSGKNYTRFNIGKEFLNGLFAPSNAQNHISITPTDDNYYAAKEVGTDGKSKYKYSFYENGHTRNCLVSEAVFEQMAAALYNLVDTVYSNYDKLFSTLDPVWFERQSSDGPKTLYKTITSDAANLFSQISGDPNSAFLGTRTTSSGSYKLLSDTYRNKADELYKSNDIVEFLDEYWAKENFTINDNFQKIKEVLVLDRLMDAYGEPKVTYIDKYNKNEDGEAKAQWYINLYNRIKDGGYHVLKDGLASSAEWIKFAFESGTVTLEQVDDKYTWNKMIYTNSSDITEQTNNAAVAKAEAEYNAAMNKIENKDKRYDLELKNIDTEHNSLQTEYESIKKAIEQNVSRTFKIYS